MAANAYLTGSTRRCSAHTNLLPFKHLQYLFEFLVFDARETRLEVFYFDLRLDVGPVVIVGLMPIAFGLPVLRHHDKCGKKYRLEGYDHGEESVGKDFDRIDDPEAEPHDVDEHERPRADELGYSVGAAVRPRA